MTFKVKKALVQLVIMRTWENIIKIQSDTKAEIYRREDEDVI